MAETDKHLEPFHFKLDGNILHLKTFCDKKIYYLCAWYFRNFSSEQTRSSDGFKEKDGLTHRVQLEIHPQHACINMSSGYLWDISVSTHSGNMQLGETLLPSMQTNPQEKYEWKVHSVTIEGEDFQKLQNSSGIITCRMVRCKDQNHVFADIFIKFSARNLEYLKSLEADLKSYSCDFSKEKVSLCVGQNTEIVNKAVLCSRSPVFARMFDSDMRERKKNTVTITDIKITVLKALISFLYSGLLPEYGLNFVCELYYAANKYDIWELQQACIRNMLNKITLQNVARVLKLSSLHNDNLLMFAVMTVVHANLESVALTTLWKSLMRDDPQVALKASTFF